MFVLVLSCLSLIQSLGFFLLSVFFPVSKSKPVQYIVPHFYGGGRGDLIKGLEKGKEIKEGKKRKKENLGKIKLLAVPIHKN